MNKRDEHQTRCSLATFQTREENGDMYISGYFAVFNSVYEIYPGVTESINPTAFDDTLSDDIRALINHDSTLVLGRTRAATLSLKADSKGLWGDIKINPKDQDAVNLYERVKRKDVDQCSFGFDILEERYIEQDNNSVRWIIEKVKLYEVSVVTFPAYEDTSVSARSRQLEEIRKKKADSFKIRMMSILKGE